MEQYNVHEILRAIRKRKQYQSQMVAEEMFISRQKLHTLETRWVEITSNFLAKWLRAVDIPPKDHAWFQQKYHRERIAHLIEDATKRMPAPKKKLVVDLIALYDCVSDNLLSALRKELLAAIEVMPREAQVANENIYNERNT